MLSQQITLLGNLGSDPEMRYTPDSQAVVGFRIAVNRKYTGKTGEVKETAWFSVSAWGKLAEACGQYLKRGSKVLVTGRLRVDPATGGPRVFTKKDGTLGASFEVTADDVTFLGGTNEESSGPVDMSAPRPANRAEPAADSSPASEEFIF